MSYIISVITLALALIFSFPTVCATARFVHLRLNKYSQIKILATEENPKTVVNDINAQYKNGEAIFECTADSHIQTIYSVSTELATIILTKTHLVHVCLRKIVPTIYIIAFENVGELSYETTITPVKGIFNVKHVPTYTFHFKAKSENVQTSPWAKNRINEVSIIFQNESNALTLIRCLTKQCGMPMQNLDLEE